MVRLVEACTTPLPAEVAAEIMATSEGVAGKPLDLE